MPRPTNQPDETNYSLFERTGPFTALTSLIRQHADNPDTQPALDRETADQLAVMVAGGQAPALVAAMAATTGAILQNWFSGNTSQQTLLHDLRATIAQPGWSPATEPALTAARDIVADYVTAPRSPDADLDQILETSEPIEHSDILNAGLMMCLELLRAGRRTSHPSNT